tara:strand:+ start:8438 stop:8662 length:225 start_codon:yes stop_codon:yes gene_type:complete
MSAEKEALVHLDAIFTEIKDTLQEANKNRKDSKQLTNEENTALTNILTKLKQVRTKLNDYIKQFRVQSSLDQFN